MAALMNYNLKIKQRNTKNANSLIMKNEFFKLT